MNSSMIQFLTGLVSTRFLIILSRLWKSDPGDLSKCAMEALGTAPYIVFLAFSETHAKNVTIWSCALVYDQVSPLLHTLLLRKMLVRDVKTTLDHTVSQVSMSSVALVGANIFLLLERKFADPEFRLSEFNLYRLALGISSLLLYLCLAYLTFNLPQFKRRERLANLQMEKLYKLSAFFVHTALAYTLVALQLLVEQLYLRSRFFVAGILSSSLLKLSR